MADDGLYVEKEFYELLLDEVEDVDGTLRTYLLLIDLDVYYRVLGMIQRGDLNFDAVRVVNGLDEIPRDGAHVITIFVMLDKEVSACKRQISSERLSMAGSIGVTSADEAIELVERLGEIEDKYGSLSGSGLKDVPDALYDFFFRDPGTFGLSNGRALTHFGPTISITTIVQGPGRGPKKVNTKFVAGAGETVTDLIALQLPASVDHLAIMPELNRLERATTCLYLNAAIKEETYDAPVAEGRTEDHEHTPCSVDECPKQRRRFTFPERRTTSHRIDRASMSVPPR